MNGFFLKLKARLFGKPKNSERIKPHKDNTKRPDALIPPPEPIQSMLPVTSDYEDREPYFIQIGLDFGTAFCKCVYRDIIIDKARIHYPSETEDSKMPFLIGSSLCFDGKTMQKTKNTQKKYHQTELNYVKTALQKVGLHEWKAPVLEQYRAAAPGESDEDMAKFVEVCAIYLIAGVLGNVKREADRPHPGKNKNDYMAVNMAIPVADTNNPVVHTLFERTLRRAWILADDLAGHPSISYTELTSLIKAKSDKAEAKRVKDACLIYPEVSANVQGFVRSRTSSTGLYIFSDTGAGTVDQSVFLFSRPDGKELLTYLYAEVLSLGSSLLEKLAANEDGDDSWENLERWRQRKEEAREDYSQLAIAKCLVKKQLEEDSKQTIARGKKKLCIKRQINKLRVIFGGGGHCKNPYRSAVINQFYSDLFRPEEIDRRRYKGDSFELGMPIPKDLTLNGNQRQWMNRLNVAYGLSFERNELVTFMYAKYSPKNGEIWRSERQTPRAPTKDEV